MFVQLFTPRWREESSILGEDLVGNSERRLLAKHEQFVVLLKKLTERGNSEIIVADLMTQQHMSTIQESASAKLARELMKAGNTRHLLVQNDAGHLVGIINDRDLLRRRGRTAGCIMTKDLIVVTPDCPAANALSRVIRKRLSCLPVVNMLKPVGVVTRTDLLLAFEALLDFIRDRNLFNSPNPASLESSATADTEALESACL